MINTAETPQTQFGVIPKPSFWKSIRRFVFSPKMHHDMPAIPPGLRSMITAYIDIQFGFFDRIKILLGAKVSIKTSIGTENEAGDNRALDTSLVLD